MAKLEGEYGRAPTDSELADELGISEDEYISWQGQAKVTNLVSLDEFMESGGEKSSNAVKASAFEQPEAVIEKNEIKEILMETLELLTEKEKKVILLYYYEELTLKEISKVLGVSESRVSQLHTKALQKMKTKLSNISGFHFDV